MANNPLIKYIDPFLFLLENVNPERVSTHTYATSYLTLLLDNKKYYLHIYAEMLWRATLAANKGLGEICLVDFGCGNGLLGLFAKYAGAKSVVAIDFSADFLLSAQCLGKLLGIEMDGWVEGNEFSLGKLSTIPDVVLGSDVIEHIYDLNAFFSILKDINPKVCTVFTTASVNENPYKWWQTIWLMIQDEYWGSDPLHNLEPSLYDGMSFLEVRKRIVLDYMPSLNEKAAVLLSKATRGLKREDIYAVLDDYKNRGVLPKGLKHPFNTCDPITGSWTERLMGISEYRRLYLILGFDLCVYHGFYNAYQGGGKGVVLGFLNKAIGALGAFGVHLTPFIVLVGKGTGS